MSEGFKINAGDGKRLHVYRWLPDGQPRGVLQIAHGMGEHAARYADAAAAFTNAGYAVYANDHRGHGATADPDALGWMGENGWNRVVADAADLTNYIRGEHPDMPLALVGHSMGAMLTQQYLYRFGSSLDAAVLSGCPGVAGRFQSWLSRTLARIESWRLGPDGESPLLQKLLFGKANDAFDGPDSTGFEWLSRDADQVAAYVNDPHCGFVLRCGSLLDLFIGSKQARDMENVLQIPANLPLYVFSGSDDPVHGEGRNLERMLDLYRRHLRQVDERIYPGGRHEMLNETNRDEVIQDLLDWLDKVLPKAAGD
jgi:alpha-beta hydrolase superfamily lysophospholipase